jgi:hypothetical protein
MVRTFRGILSYSYVWCFARASLYLDIFICTSTVRDERGSWVRVPVGARFRMEKGRRGSETQQVGIIEIWFKGELWH